MMQENKKETSLRILSIGNSFSVDTMHHLPKLLSSLDGVRVRLGNLYIGGCSIRQHHANAEQDASAYKYYTSDGGEWTERQAVSIREAIESEAWDYISIQHGTKDGSRYTERASYEHLQSLVAYVRALADGHTKIAFNMAWVMEPYGTHPEIVSYGGDQALMYQRLTNVTEHVVKPTKHLDILCPCGTAIQNARGTALCGRLSRDGFHLSYDMGRYIASLTFLKALTGWELSCLSWRPDGVTEADRAIAMQAANLAVETPFAVSPMREK